MDVAFPLVVGVIVLSVVVVWGLTIGDIRRGKFKAEVDGRLVGSPVHGGPEGPEISTIEVANSVTAIRGDGADKGNGRR